MKSQAQPLVQIPTEIAKLCDELSVCVTFADPDAHDMPLVYVNKAFEKLTQWPSEEVIGKNCRFLQGPKTDRTLVEDMALSFRAKQSEICALINYRRDGSEFLNLLLVRPVFLTKTQPHLMGCQSRYHIDGIHSQCAPDVAAIDTTIRHLFAKKPVKIKPTSPIETFALDAVLMRFNMAYAKVQNALVARAATKMRREISED